MAEAALAFGSAAGRPALRLRLPRRETVLALALLAPSLALLGVFTYGPIVEIIWEALHEHARRTTRFDPLVNFLAIARDPTFGRALVNNAIYALCTVVPSLVLALAFALALGRSTRLNALLRSIVFLPVLVPLVAAASIFLFLFLPGLGLIDYHLAKLGLSGPNWLGDPDVALYAIAVLTVWKNAGYYMLFFLAGLQAIPADTYEAAHIDGANAWQRLRHVTLPGLRPTIAFIAVVALLNVVTQVDHVFVLTKGGPSDSTKLLLFYVYEQAVERYEPGKAAAATLVMLAILLALSAASLRRLEHKLEASAR